MTTVVSPRGDVGALVFVTYCLYLESIRLNDLDSFDGLGFPIGDWETSTWGLPFSLLILIILLQGEKH